MTIRVAPPSEPERAVLAAVVGPATNGDGAHPDDAPLDELRALVVSAGGEVADTVVQRRDAIDPAYFIGRGKAEQVRDAVVAADADMVVFDNDLSPAQGKNLEDLIGVRVLDRSELILDLFAERARTREAKLQVELAQLQYLLPRLRRMWTHLSRIRGGIGLRGPGETQLEVDRRAIRGRIATLKEKLAGIERRRHLQRKSRGGEWNVALVGYTNVGKSTILNRLADEALRAENRLFATLDATTRRVTLPGGEALLVTDTVGFIRDLPHHLVASFRATLEEVVHADLLLHVVDVADSRREERMRIVRDVLDELGVAETPVLHVFNKFDRVPAEQQGGVAARVHARHPEAVLASAVQPSGMEPLVEALQAFVRHEEVEARVTLPLAATRELARLYDLTEVVSRRYGPDAVEVELRARPDVVRRLRSEGIDLRTGP